MVYDFLQMSHVFAALLMLFGLGGFALHALNGGTPSTNSKRRLPGMIHGVVMVFLLIGGVVMLLIRAEQTIGWLVVKLASWVLFAGAVTLLGRRPTLARPLYFSLPIVAGLVWWLSTDPPF